MDKQQFSQVYSASNQDKFPAEKLPLIMDKLSNLDESRQTSLQYLKLKSPMVSIILSIFFGCLGVDRFYIGDVGLGILKLVCSIICLCTVFLAFVPVIWGFVDIYFCYKKTKEKNFDKLMISL